MEICKEISRQIALVQAEFVFKININSGTK